MPSSKLRGLHIHSWSRETGHFQNFVHRQVGR